MAKSQGLGLDEGNQDTSVRNVKNEFKRIGSEVLLLLGTLALAVLFLLVDFGIKRLSAIVLEDPTGLTYRILAFVLDTTFAGVAITISVTGAIAIAAEFTASTFHHIRGLGKK